jgi:anaerobic magnesium-protoporphyrin IX monomethyl ester cyclase
MNAARNRVLFINPPQSAPAGFEFCNIKTPLGYIYMAGVLEEHGFEVRILDCPLEYRTHTPVDATTIRIGTAWADIAVRVRDFAPAVIGVGCAYSAFESDSFALIASLHEAFPDIPVVVGGAHTSANPAYVLRNPHVAVAVIGEGEQSMLEIAQAVRDGRPLDGIPGTATRVDGQPRIHPPREYIQDLDTLHPAWHLLDLPAYFRHPANSDATLRRNSVDIVTSRGCPGRCVFCSIVTVWGRGWRSHGAQHVVDEIEMLVRRYGARQFRFQDDNLTLKRDRILAICDEILRRKLDIRWDTPNGVAIWTLDEEVIARMRAAGCYRLTFGIESGSARTQKYIGKIVAEDKIRRLIRCCHHNRIWACGTFIIGFPDETRDDIRETERMVLTCGINFAFIYIAQPLPGTRMMEDFRRHGLMDAQRFGSMLGHSEYDTLHFKAAEINALLRDLYRQFYRRKFTAYLNPLTLWREVLCKLRTPEEWLYFLRMLANVLFAFRQRHTAPVHD